MCIHFGPQWTDASHQNLWTWNAGLNQITGTTYLITLITTHHQSTIQEAPSKKQYPRSTIQEPRSTIHNVLYFEFHNIRCPVNP